MPLEPNVVPLACSNNKIRPVHQDPNAAVLVHPRITRNAKGDFIPEKPAFSKTPIGSSTSRINQMRDLHPFRTYRTGPEKRNRLLSYVIVEYLEIPLLKVRDTLSRRRRNYDIEANVSRSGTAFRRGLLRRGCRSTKHHSRQNGKYTFVDEHKLTPMVAVRYGLRALVSNCMRDHTLGVVSSPHQGTIAQNAIQLPIHNRTLDTHDKINPDTKQSGASRTAPFNAPTLANQSPD
jgi:hypothetical protein